MDEGSTESVDTRVVGTERVDEGVLDNQCLEIALAPVLSVDTMGREAFHSLN